MPREYRWEMQEAKKEQMKGKKAGGMVSGVRFRIKEVTQKEDDGRYFCAIWKDKGR